VANTRHQRQYLVVEHAQHIVCASLELCLMQFFRRHGSDLDEVSLDWKL
jgi:hypothetical protein